MAPKAAFDDEDHAAVYGGLQRSVSLMEPTVEVPKFIELSADDSGSDGSDMDTNPDDFDYTADYGPLSRSDTTTVPSRDVKCHGCVLPPRKRPRFVRFAD